MAFEVLARDMQPPHVAAALLCRAGASRRAAAMVGGQVDDIQAEFQGGRSGALESIHRRKTGAMINVSLRDGGVGGRGHR